MNPTIELLHKHVSIPSYAPEPLTDEQRDVSFRAANRTSGRTIPKASRTLSGRSFRSCRTEDCSVRNNEHDTLRGLPELPYPEDRHAKSHR
ncbi:hypothetical protein [Saccharibacillus deserti]|uniref:hypothetical protein n=1 Tax=Saccharibacillus deserti TaxID=1634444 RepID=UPI001556812D|nr:hypothetical protein [Saccharibacillus deserti]